MTSKQKKIMQDSLIAKRRLAEIARHWRLERMNENKKNKKPYDDMPCDRNDSPLQSQMQILCKG